MKFNDCPAYLQEYLNYIETVKLRSELTVKNYYTDIKLFLRFLKMSNNNISESEFDTITIEDVSESMIRKVTLNDILA
ncbi:MAG: site-specific integrase, partial [Ruminiclostridium sp.]|nr:site-specific integrase [Ruminiclostridium sp.]